MSIPAPTITSFSRTGSGGQLTVSSGGYVVEVYGHGLFPSGGNYHDLVLLGSGLGGIPLDFSAFMVGPIFWNIPIPCTVFAIATDGSGNYSPPSVVTVPALIDAQPISFTVSPLRRSVDRTSVLFDVVGMADPVNDILIALRDTGTGPQVYVFVGDGTNEISGLAGTDFVSLVLVYMPYGVYNVAGILTLAEPRRLTEVVHYSPVMLGKDTSATFVVPLFDAVDAPLTGVVGGDLAVVVVSALGGVVSVTIGPTAVWTELSDGYYTLTLDGVTFFSTVGLHQLDIRHASAVPVRYAVNVTANDPESGTFYDTVRDGQGTPVPDVEVAVYEHGTTNLLYTTRTYVNGQFSIPLSAVAPITLVDIVLVPTGQPSFRRDGVVLT